MGISASVRNETQKELGFPKIMISDSGTVVLFEGYCKGTVLKCSPYDYCIGYYSDGWDMSAFTNLNEQVVLRNL